jgi:hypothetical protein
MNRTLRALAAAGAALLLAACASAPQFTQVGTPRAQILQNLGQPTATYPLPGGGERLQYSRQPAGQQVYNVDLGADGRLLRPVEQAMDPAVFDRIGIDTWTTQDVLRAFGKPARIERVWSFDGDVWVYRYEDFYWYWVLGVHIDRSGVVRKVSRGEEFPRPGQYE